MWRDSKSYMPPHNKGHPTAPVLRPKVSMKQLQYTKELHILRTAHHDFYFILWQMFTKTQRRKGKLTHTHMETCVTPTHVADAPPPLIWLRLLWPSLPKAEGRSLSSDLNTTCDCSSPSASHNNSVMKLQTLVMRAAAMASSSFGGALRPRDALLDCLGRHWLGRRWSWSPSLKTQASQPL